MPSTNNTPTTMNTRTRYTLGHVLAIGAVCAHCSTLTERAKWDASEATGGPCQRIAYPNESHYNSIPCYRCGLTFIESKEQNA